jgi:cysteinyl-tRNA synthetase
MECSAMGTKYLGEHFDIHGGGMDLLFPHHESEIAQVNAAKGHEAVKYWMHNNMITIDGQKMGKSLNNSITLNEFFSGDHEALEHAYSPMVIRFFMLQAHYRSTLDFSNEALKAAEKGMSKLFEAYNLLDRIKPSVSSVDIKKYHDLCYDALNDDFNTPIALAHLFDMVKMINQVNDGKESFSDADISFAKNLLETILFQVFGLKDENVKDDSRLIDELMGTILNIRKQAKQNKDYATADRIREELGKLNIQIKDGKEGSSWVIK